MKPFLPILLSFAFWGCKFFTAPDDSLLPVTEANMKMIWEIQYEPAGSGVNASPLILGDSLVIMSAGNYMYAIDQRTGNIRWTYKESDVTCSQTKEYATDGVRIYTTEVEDIRAINISDGSQAWIRPLPDERGGFWTNSPTINSDLLFVSSYRTLFCINPSTGAVIWSKSIFPSRGLIGNSAFFNNSVIIGGGYGFNDTSGTTVGSIGKIYSLNCQTGDTIWSATTTGDGNTERIIVDNGIIFSGTDWTWSSGSFEAREATTGKVIWSYYTRNQAWCYKDCILVDDKIIVNSGLSNYVCAFNKSSGQLSWRISLPGNPLQEKHSYYKGFVYITQGWKLFVINPDNGGIVYSLKPKGRDLVTIAVGNDKVFVCGYPTLQCYQTYKP